MVKILLKIAILITVISFIGESQISKTHYTREWGDDTLEIHKVEAAKIYVGQTDSGWLENSWGSLDIFAGPNGMSINDNSSSALMSFWGDWIYFNVPISFDDTLNASAYSYLARERLGIWITGQPRRTVFSLDTMYICSTSNNIVIGDSLRINANFFRNSAFSVDKTPPVIKLEVLSDGLTGTPDFKYQLFQSGSEKFSGSTEVVGPCRNILTLRRQDEDTIVIYCESYPLSGSSTALGFNTEKAAVTFGVQMQFLPTWQGTSSDKVQVLDAHLEVIEEVY